MSFHSASRRPTFTLPFPRSAHTPEAGRTPRAPGQDAASSDKACSVSNSTKIPIPGHWSKILCICMVKYHAFVKNEQGGSLSLDTALSPRCTVKWKRDRLICVMWIVNYHLCSNKQTMCTLLIVHRPSVRTHKKTKTKGCLWERELGGWKTDIILVPFKSYTIWKDSLLLNK